MTAKPSYEELERRVQELEKTESKYKSSKEALRENESLFKMLYEKAPLGYQSLDENGHFIVINQTWLDTLGYTKEEVIGKSFADFLHPDWRDHFKENFPRFKSIGEVLDVEFEMVKKNRDLILVSLTEKISRDKKGAFQQTHCIFHDITKRKQVNEKLRKNEARHSKMVANIGDVIVIIDQEGINKYKSPNIEKLFGWKPEEVVGKSTWDNVHPDDIESTQSFFEKMMHTPDAVGTMECRYLCNDGSYKWIEFSGSNLFHDPDIQGLLGNYHNITERKQTEEALRNSEQKHRRLFETMAQGIVYQAADGSIISANPAAERILGLTFEQMQGKTSMDPQWKMILKDGTTVPGREHPSMIALRSKSTVGPVVRGVFHPEKNAYVWLSITATLLFQPGETKPFQVYTTFEDITENLRIEKALRDSEQMYRTTFDAIPDSITVTRQKDGRYKYVNDGFCNINGYSRDEVIGKTPIEINLYVNPSDRERMTQTLRQNRELLNFEIPFRRKNGTIFDSFFSARPIIIDGEDCLIALAKDVTEFKRAEEEKAKLETQLNQAQKIESVGRLAGGVAHDFNNMLGVILGYVEIALEKAEQDHDLHANLKEIQKAAQRSADITKQLLAFARKQIISPRQLDLNDTVESMLNMLRRLIGEDIDLVWQPAAHIRPVKMDTSQIDQILANLCINARDAISGVGKLTIETGRKSFDEEYCSEHPGFIPGDFVLLAVSDNGCGMDRETLGNLFEPFFTTKEVGKGTGLGLATVYGIVKQNNGFIDVYSEPGQGTTFKIYLPRLVAEEDTDMAIPGKKPAAGGTETILLVEDEPAILTMTCMMLERNGYSVLSAARPVEAIEMARSHTDKIHLLMTDVVMPEMNGRDLSGQITHLYPDIKLLFMSGYTANVIAHQGVLDDGVAFIQKPFSIADLTEKVREVLDKTLD